MFNSNFMVAFLVLSCSFLGGMENSQAPDENWVRTILQEYQKRFHQRRTPFGPLGLQHNFNAQATEQFETLLDNYLDKPLDNAFKNQFYKLLHDGADIYNNITHSIIGTEERSAIHRAAAKGNLALVRILFDAGHDNNYWSDAYNPAQQASNGYLLRLLVKGGSVNLFSKHQECYQQILVFEEVLDHLFPQWNKEIFDNIKEIFTGREALDMHRSEQKIKTFILKKNIPRLVNYLTKEHKAPVDGDQRIVPALLPDVLNIIVSMVIQSYVKKATTQQQGHYHATYDA